ncbi:MAG TPA: type II secretion system protein, partial [Casimicrobiaceae bacterium]|nr:type II secretion system protein [Casimicrobiaceae bacterium]
MRARGFTLLEILVVITIIAFASSLAVLSIAPDQRGTMARESKRFAGALEYLAQRAQWRSETLGVSAQGPLIRYWKHAPDEDRWLRIDDDDVLRAQTLPDA